MIKTKEQIIEHFKSGSKDASNLKIGVEHEKFIFDKKTNKRIDYTRITQMFEKLYEFGWKPIFEGKHVIALKKNDKNITLEPGNQIELSGAKLNNIHETCGESHEYLFELKQVIEKLDLKIVSSGYDPISTLREIPNNPKKRYEVMTKDMPIDGKLSLDMMYKTAGTQLNLDYTSEADFIKKFKLANNLVPISIGLFANSSIVEKSDSGYLSYRSKVWQDTSRGGLPELFLKDVNFDMYAEFVMNYPMLFLENDGKFISGKKYLFKDFMHGEIEEVGNKIPNTDDLNTHLGTIFTENRLKQYIELRSMDACGWDCLCAGPALFTGLLYGNIDEALDLIKNWEVNEVLTAYKNAPKHGLKTSLMGKEISFWAEKLIEISKSGLKKRDFLNRKKISEVKFLDHLEKIVKDKKTNADNIINKYSNSENLNDLYDQ